MSNISTLKDLFGDEIDHLESRIKTIRGGFDAVKEIEGLAKAKKDINAELDAVRSDYTHIDERLAEARAEVSKMQTDCAAKVEAAELSVKSSIDEAEKLAAAIVSDAQDVNDALQSKSKALNATIATKEARADAAETRTTNAESELERIRGQLKSI